jgi:penicillin-binding protein 1A
MRQAGSAFKPFTLAAALEHGISLYSYYSGPPELTIPDLRCSTGNQLWLVHNNADETAGTMNLIDATANSVNTIFAQIVAQVGPDAVVRMAHRLGITSDLLPVCSITLGTQAVNPLEMTAAYATLADHGLRHDPVAIRSIAVTQKGTGTAANIGRPIAGKTGTAERFVDAWFCGFVPQLVTCVWVGYPHREAPMNDVEGYAPVYGGTIPATIWHDFMSTALAQVPVEQLPSAPVSTVSSTYSTTSTTTTP